MIGLFATIIIMSSHNDIIKIHFLRTLRRSPLIHNSSLEIHFNCFNIKISLHIFRIRTKTANFNTFLDCFAINCIISNLNIYEKKIQKL